MARLAHRDDCGIERNDPNYPASAVLYDCDGMMIRRFDEDWTDEQIWAALEFANRAYQQGYATGEQVRAAAIRKLIEPAVI